jgi:hypothetical protein
MRKYLVNKAVFLIVTFGAVEAASASDILVRRATDPGSPVDIWSHSSLRRDCYTRAPVVTIIEHPAQGALAVTEGPRTISGARGDLARCNGQVGHGALLRYAPNAGFEGRDRLRYAVRFESGKEIQVTASIRVGRPQETAGAWRAPQGEATPGERRAEAP